MADRCAVIQIAGEDHSAVEDRSAVVDRDAAAARVVIRVAPNVVLSEAQSVVQFVAQGAARDVTQVVVVVRAGQQVVRCAARDCFAAPAPRYPADHAIASLHLQACSVAPCGRDALRFEADLLVDPLAGCRCFCDRLVDPDE